MNKLDTIYNLQLKITVPEDPTIYPTVSIKLGKGTIYYNELQNLSPDLKFIVNACVGHDKIALRKIEELTNNILPNNI